jgi:hypothetical protein
VGNTGSHSLARYLRPRRSLRRLADMQALARHEQDQGKAITETVMSVVRLNGGVPLLHAMVNSPIGLHWTVKLRRWPLFGASARGCFIVQ